MNPTIEALREKLQQLQQLHRSGDLSSEAYAEARAPLERELVALVLAAEPAVPPAAHGTPATPATAASADATPSTGTSAAPAPRPSRRLWTGVFGGVVALAAIGYGMTGSPGLALHGAPPAQVAQGPAADGGPPVTEQQVREMVDRLAQRLKESPDDVVGWTMLARAYGVMGRSDEAVDAFRRALALAPRDAGLMADLADALAAQKNGDLSGEPTQLVQRALAADPDNLKALALSGSAAFDRRDYATAVRHWERVRDALPPDSGFLAQVNASIAQARELGGLPPSSAASGPLQAGTTQRAAAAEAIKGTVSLSPALQARAAPDDAVFIVARPADGSRMPLAVLRKQVRDLPISFTLDDSLAMAPTARLSDHQQVVVLARVSKSGNALPQAGDLSGESAPVTPGVDGLRIEIDQEVGSGTAR